MKINVVSVNISEKKGTIKKPVKSVELSEIGIANDAHSGPWHRQISLLAKESIAKFEQQAKRTIKHGEFAENITTEGFELYKTAPMDKFINPNLELMVTQIGKKCHGDNCAIFREVGNCVMPKEGIFATVIRGGQLTANTEFEYVPRVFRIMVITLSDRASAGVYDDKSGPHLQKMASEYFDARYRTHSFDYHVIPDDESRLRELLQTAIDQQYDMVFTTGGTGIGPRDITPEVAKSFLDKEIPGIMELIRVKYGQKKPNALLSRSVAGVAKQTLIYTLPGSTKAVTEYMNEILPTVEHSIYMLHGLDLH